MREAGGYSQRIDCLLCAVDDVDCQITSTMREAGGYSQRIDCLLCAVDDVDVIWRRVLKQRVPVGELSYGTRRHGQRSMRLDD